jgi:ribonuclease J
MKFYNTKGSKDQKTQREPIATIQNTGNVNKALPVKIIALSGTENVTKNMTVYECGDDIMIVDCGIGFPDAEMFGIDVVIPDFSYLVENKDRIRGLVITHAHEDHFGAVAYLMRELNIPIYANALVQGFIKERLKDKGPKDADKNVSFNLIGPDVSEISIGNFKVSTFRVNHSVPTALGISINTPQGRILHMADYKVDWTPILDKPIDIATISRYGDEGVLCLLSDCLGCTTEGYTKSEKMLSQTFHDLFEDARDRQIMVTTISSNLSRMHQIIEAAIKQSRKVVLGGRSIQQSVRIARGLGILKFDDSVFVADEKSGGYDQKDLVYIVAGCYGQQGSTLDRVSRKEHDTIKIEDKALVIFSADPNPPGVEQAVEKVINNLILEGAEVFYSQIQQNLHVSGHGLKGDLTMIAALVKPQYFIPIGGTIAKARAYKNMVADLGFNPETVFELLEGESVVFENNSAHIGPRIHTKQVLIDGSSVGTVGEIVIRDREQLSNDGVFVVVVPMGKETNSVTGGVEVVTRGFIYVKESKELMGQTKDMINKLLEKDDASGKNWPALQGKIEREVQRFLYKKTGRDPMVIVHTIAV